MLAFHLRAELLKSGDVQVETARTDVVAARQGDMRLATTGEQRAKHADRRAQPPHQVVVGLVADRVGNVDDQSARRALDAATEPAHQLRHDVDVEDRAGTWLIVLRPGASKAAAISLRTLFLAPVTLTSPTSRAPPITRMRSTGAA